MKLTNEQAKIVEDNCGLIYSFAKRYCIDLCEDDNYGLLAIGLCKAAQKYNPNKGSFSTIAYYAMRSEIRHNYTTQTYIKRDVRRINKYNDFEDVELGGSEVDINQSEDVLLSHIEYKNILNYLKQVLSDRRYAILEYTLKGYTLMEIGRMLNISHQAVSTNIKVIRQALEEYLKGEE